MRKQLFDALGRRDFNSLRRRHGNNSNGLLRIIRKSVCDEWMRGCWCDGDGPDVSWPYVGVGCTLGTARCAATRGWVHIGAARCAATRGWVRIGHSTLCPYAGMGAHWAQHAVPLRMERCAGCVVAMGVWSVSNHYVQRPVMRLGISTQLRGQLGFGCCVSVHQAHLTRRDWNVAHKSQ